MTMRDVQFSFTDSASSPSASLVNSAGTFLLPNSLDTAPLGAYLSENTAADTQLSGNVNTYREMGGGERLWAVVDVTTTAVGAGATVTFNLITSASSALSSPVIVVQGSAIAVATLVAGYRLIYALPRTTAWLEWIGIQYVIATAALTAGAVVAWIGWDIDSVDLGGASGFSIK